jgi:hypothetical protein
MEFSTEFHGKFHEFTERFRQGSHLVLLIQHNMRIFTEQNDARVAFQARRSNDPFDVTTGGTIAYDYIITNVGSAYDNLSGVFTAPVPGKFNQTFNLK